MLMRYSSPLFLMNQIQIPKDSKNHKWNCEGKLVGMELSFSFWCDGIQRISDHTGGCHDSYHLIQKIRTVKCKIFAMLRCVLRKGNQFVTPLAESQKHRKQECAEQ